MNIKIQIPEKIASVFTKLEGKNLYYVFVGVLVLVFLLDYFILMRPQLAALGKINPEIRTLSENINKAKEDIDKLNTYKADLERASKKFTEANVKVKSRDEISVILEYIAYVANDTGVKIDQIMPDMIAQEPLTQNDQRKYYDLPIYKDHHFNSLTCHTVI